MKPFFTLIVLVLATFSVFAQSASDTKTLNLQIKGMTCSGCVSLVENSLKKIDGITSTNVNLEKALGVIQYDPAKVKEEAIIAAVEKAGGNRHSFKAEKTNTGTESQMDLPDCCKPPKVKQDMLDCCKPTKEN